MLRGDASHRKRSRDGNAPIGPASMPPAQITGMLARAARTGRNPRTGDAVTVEEKYVPFFKTGKLLRDRLNGG